MLFAKKKSGPRAAASAGSTGLFVDVDVRTLEEGGTVVEMADAVSSVPARAEPTFSVDAAEAEPGAPKSPEFGGLRVKKVPAPFAEAAKPAPVSDTGGGIASLRSRFGSKKATTALPVTEIADVDAPFEPVSDAAAPARTAAAPARTAAAPKPAKSSLFGKPKVSKEAEAPKESKVPKAKKERRAGPVKAPRFSGKAPKRVTLMAELDSGRQLFWTLEGDKLAQTTETPTGSVFSFSKEDLRFKAPKALSYQQAHDLALQEIGEAVQIVNRTRDLSTVYATRQERALDAAFLIAPGQQVLDRILVKNKQTGVALICGFLLKDGADGDSLAVLFHIGVDGEASKPQISVNPDSMEFVIAQFSASRKLDKANTEVVLYENADFLAACAGAVAYPNETIWRGVPARQVIHGFAACTVAVSLCFAAWAGYTFQDLQTLQGKQSRLRGDLAKIKNETSDLVGASVPDFVTAMSLDVPQMASRAQSLWVTDSRLTLAADQTTARYTLSMPVQRGTVFNNRPSALNPITVEQQKTFVQSVAPAGCTRTAIGIAGGFNETQFTVTCETGNSALAHYRND